MRATAGRRVCFFEKVKIQHKEKQEAHERVCESVMIQKREAAGAQRHNLSGSRCLAIALPQNEHEIIREKKEENLRRKEKEKEIERERERAKKKTIKRRERESRRRKKKEETKKEEEKKKTRESFLQTAIRYTSAPCMRAVSVCVS